MSSGNENGRKSWKPYLLVSLWSAALLAVAGIGLYYSLNMYLGSGSREVRYSGEADIRSVFTLTDHTGQVVTQADYLDRWQLVFLASPIVLMSVRRHSPTWPVCWIFLVTMPTR